MIGIYVVTIITQENNLGEKLNHDSRTVAESISMMRFIKRATSNSQTLAYTYTLRIFQKCICIFRVAKACAAAYMRIATKPIRTAEYKTAVPNVATTVVILSGEGSSKVFLKLGSFKAIIETISGSMR